MVSIARGNVYVFVSACGCCHSLQSPVPDGTRAVKAHRDQVFPIETLTAAILTSSLQHSTYFKDIYDWERNFFNNDTKLSQ